MEQLRSRAGASYLLHFGFGGVDVVVQPIVGQLGFLRFFTLSLKLLFTLRKKHTERQSVKCIKKHRLYILFKIK